MTIKHIVLLAFKPSLSKKDIENIMLTLGALKKDIPQMMSFSWGENNSPENLHQGYSHGFIMEFKNDADRQIYLDHPLHEIAKEKLIAALAHSALVFDYTFSATRASGSEIR